jgi:hypothetical protein
VDELIAMVLDCDDEVRVACVRFALTLMPRDVMEQFIKEERDVLDRIDRLEKLLGTAKPEGIMATRRRAVRALWATRDDAPSNRGADSGQASANPGASFTISHVIPWMWVNSIRGRGGLIRRLCR